MFLRCLTSFYIGVILDDTPEALVLVARIDSSAWDVHSFTACPDPKDWDKAIWREHWKPWEPTRHPVGAPDATRIENEEALRTIVRGRYKDLRPRFAEGVLEALASVFPDGPVCYFDAKHGLMGRFKYRQDAEMMAQEIGGEPIIFDSPEQLKSIPRAHLDAVAAALEVAPPPAKLTNTHTKELYDMAAKKAKSTKKKAAVKRTDGAVARAWNAFDKVNDPKDTEKMLAAAAKAGVEPGTAKTQLYKWRKEHGVKVTRGRAGGNGAAKKSTKKVAAKKKAKPAKKAKPRPASVKAQAAKAERKPRAKRVPKPESAQVSEAEASHIAQEIAQGAGAEAQPNA